MQKRAVFATSEERHSTSNPSATTAFGPNLLPYPRVLLAILAKQAAKVLPFYLQCIAALDYPKDAIALYVRTNNNTDRTSAILQEWLAGVRLQYAHIEFDASDVPEPVEQYGIHEWNTTRFKVLASIRQQSLQRTLQRDCQYYFVVDVDNFIKPNTLKDLVSVRLPIVAPLLRHVDQEKLYSNFHAEIDEQGYFRNCQEYHWLVNQRVKGLCQVPVVHCTYLVRADVIPLLTYDDDSGRHEYVIFSESARKNSIPQYFDNRDIYGYLTLEEEVDKAIKLLGRQIESTILAQSEAATARSAADIR